MAIFSARTTSLKPMWVALFLVIAVALIAPPPTAEAAISCNSVLNSVTPCLNFVLVGGSPSTQCCNGVKSVFNSATTKEDRQAVCTCLKSLVGSATPGMITNAEALPGKCGVSVPYVISPSTDCSKVS
ncbi:non-specific lipid-transfer protein 1-like [Primulina huaijiensis]|uniref:non-specific lipid-transfer protein 1-like n=1 Tax=Primulina huaijiensis TaxID=1492673 RepID=UPI003CC70C93